MAGTERASRTRMSSRRGDRDTTTLQYALRCARTHGDSAISVIAPGTTSHAGPTRDESHGRSFPCEGCGAQLTFNIGQQSLTCPYCGQVKALEIAPGATVHEEDLASMLQKMRDLRAGGG